MEFVKFIYDFGDINRFIFLNVLWLLAIVVLKIYVKMINSEEYASFNKVHLFHSIKNLPDLIVATISISVAISNCLTIAIGIMGLLERIIMIVCTINIFAIGVVKANGIYRNKGEVKK